MIDFRYHIVSIVAVFLALAVGIVLGSTELQGATYSILNHTSKVVKNEYDAAQAKNALLNQQVNGDEAFAKAAEARLLDGLLDGQRVVLVTAPGAPGQVTNGVAAALQQAGAAVTGQISLQPQLFDPSENTQQELSSLVATLATPGAGTSGTALQQASQLLGSAILSKTSPADTSGGRQPSDGEAVLSSYAQAGLLSISGHPENPATLTVVITPASPPSNGSSGPANQGLITLAQGLDTAGLGTVVAGSTSGSVSGSAITALRSSSASEQISTVDDADTLIGQIVTVQALAQELTSHKTGAYGTGPGNTAAAPSPAPTPSPTGTPTNQVTTSTQVHKGPATTKTTKGHT
ncbi:MAG TPA: copper transporter [Streptosporangiaceae bacterium]